MFHRMAVHMHRGKPLRAARATGTALQPEGRFRRFLNWGHDLAGWAQVVGLAVIIFGYFYTVRPVYERDRLEEDVSRAELDLREVKRKQEVAMARNRQLESERLDLETSILSLQHDRDNSQAKVAALSVESGRLENELSKTKADLGESLTATQQLEVGNFREVLIGYTSRELFNLNRGSMPGDFLEEGLLERMEEGWIDPLPRVRAAILKIGEHPDLKSKPHLASHYAAVVERLEKRATQGPLCKRPDLAAWADAVNEVKARLAILGTHCTDERMRRFADLNKFSKGERVRYAKTDWWKEEHAAQVRICESFPKIGAENSFSSGWLNATSVCLDEAAREIAGILGEKQRKPADLTQLIPPIPDQIMAPLYETYAPKVTEDAGN